MIKSSKEMQLSNIQLKKKEMKKKKKRNQMMDIATQLVHKKFSPEFVNRIDDIIIFNQLQNDAIMKICELQINSIKKILHKKMIKMLISLKAIQHLADCGTDVKYGARPLKRLIQRVILNPLSNCILEVMTHYFVVVVVDIDDNEVDNDDYDNEVDEDDNGVDDDDEVMIIMVMVQ
jgi:ATP-dependent Clp protease ATP-binding subunit ClpA